MGFATLLDVIGSAIIGGFLLLTLFRMNNNASMNTYNFSGELTLQENLVVTVEVLEHDFRKIGYCEDPSKIINPEINSILYADTSSIKFLTDVIVDVANFRGDGIVDEIEYYLGPASELLNTPNPNDRMLYRVVNGVKTGVNLGVTEFRIRYFRDSLNAQGGTSPAEILTGELPKVWVEGTPTGITTMQIDIRVENTSTYDAAENPYRHAFWRQIRLSSRNLKR
jgi:hypothetical protein